MDEERNSILSEKRGKAGWLIFSRPERMNALGSESLRELWMSLSKLEADPDIRAAVFTGSGEDAFCAGMDMVGMERSSPLAARRRSREVQMLVNRIEDFTLPTIAAVNGIAMGVGLEICIACDFALAAGGARFGFPETRLGMIPCGGGTQRMARLVGLRRAKDMVLSGRIIDAELALEWGLLNEVVQTARLDEAVEVLVDRLVQGGKIALYQAKRCLNHSLDLDLNRGLEYETECFTTCFSTGEPTSGLGRFSPQPGPGEPETEGGEEAAAGHGEAPEEDGSAGDEDGDIFE